MTLSWGGAARAACLGIGLLAAACSTAQTDATKATDRATLQTARAAIGTCMIAPPPPPVFAIPAALGAALVGSAISTGLNLIGNALTEAGKENITQVVVSANVDGTASLEGKCLQIVRGKFDRGTGSAPAWVEMLGLSVDQYEILRSNRLGTANRPEFVFEAYFRRAGKSNTFAMVPTLVAFFHPIEQRLLRFGTERDLLVELAFHGPNKKFDDAGNPSTRVHIGNVSAPTTYFFQQPLPNRANPGESPWVAVPDSGPFTVTAAVFEIEAASQTLQFLAAVFNGSKDQLEVALKQLALKTERDKAQLAEVQAQAALRKSYNDAFSAAIAALVTCKGSGTVANIANASTAVDGANTAAVALGKSRPFQVTPFISDNTANNSATCANVLQQVSGTSP